MNINITYESFPTQGIGFWGKPTGSLDFCEENYTHSHYIAEWWNSWSNFPPIILAFYAIYKCTRSAQLRQPLPIVFAYLVPIIIYFGSFAFHATLSYYGQLLDELPMVYGTLYFHYLHSHGMKNVVLYSFAVALFITAFMLYFNDSPLPLQLSYGTLVLSLTYRSWSISNKLACTRSTSLLKMGAAVYLVAFILWITDQHYCSFTQPFHFHAFWHILSGVGAYIWIQFACAHHFYISKTGVVVEKLPILLPFCVPPTHNKTL